MFKKIIKPLSYVALLALLAGFVGLFNGCSGSGNSPSTPSTTTWYYVNWNCSGQSSCIAVMGANLGSAGPFCTTTDANNWGNQYIPSAYNTSTSPQYTVYNSPPAGTCQTWSGSGSGGTPTKTPTPGSPTATPTVNLFTITPTASFTNTKTPTPNPSWTPTMTHTFTPTGTTTPNNLLSQMSCSVVTTPYGLALDSLGNIFISDKGGSVYKYPGIGASSASVTLSVSGATTLGHLAVDSGNNVYVVESTPLSVVWEYDDNLASFTGPASFTAGLKEPCGIAIDSANNVYVSDIYLLDSPYFAVIYTSQAVSQATLAANASPSWSKPAGIAINSAGTSIYAACSNYFFLIPISPGDTKESMRGWRLSISLGPLDDAFPGTSSAQTGRTRQPNRRNKPTVEAKNGFLVIGRPSFSRTISGDFSKPVQYFLGTVL